MRATSLGSLRGVASTLEREVRTSAASSFLFIDGLMIWILLRRFRIAGERFQKIKNLFCGLSAFLSVDDQGNTVRPRHVDDVRIGGPRRFYDVDLAEHRGGENVHPRVVLEEEFGDVAPAHVRRPTERGFEIAISP